MLSIKDLSIHFGGVLALKNVSLEVQKNSIVGLMGPNGSGKTTLINCVSRIFEPTQGQILFDGKNLLKSKPQDIVQCGISRTFQDLNFFEFLPDVTILDYVMMGDFNPSLLSVLRKNIFSLNAQKNQSELRKKARFILDFFRQAREYFEPDEKERNYPYITGREGAPDLLDQENSPIQLLSLAWRRRLDLARALISQPKLLLLDEPCQGLPPFEIENLTKIIKLIQSSFGTSALIVEHNVHTLLKLSDSIVVMNFGEVLCHGKPDEVVKNEKVIDVYLGGSKEIKAEIQVSKDPGKIKPQTILKVKDLDHYYGAAQALFSINMEVEAGKIVAILGTNGSGKSTVLKVISGVEKPRYGKITFLDVELPLGWPEIASEMGIQYVPQGHLVFPELSVDDNLMLGSYTGKLRGSSPSEIKERIFSYFPELKGVLNLKAGSLSGGQQQMLAISQALVAKPQLLLLDEPSLGLSPRLKDSLFKAIKQISINENCAIILVEQSVSESFAVADFVYILSSGSVTLKGPTEIIAANQSLIKMNLGFI